MNFSQFEHTFFLWGGLICPCVLVVVWSLSLFLKARKRHYEQEYLKKVPRVPGGLPLIGHGFEYSKDPVGFMKKCFDENGDIVRFRLFNKELILTCNRDLWKTFSKATEKELSLYMCLVDTYHGDALADDCSTFPHLVEILKKSVSTGVSSFREDILVEAEEMTAKLLARTKEEGSEVDINHEILQFIVRTSARCFIKIDLDEEFYTALLKHFVLVDELVKLTYLLPLWLLQIIGRIILKPCRTKMRGKIVPIIEQCRKNPQETDSLLIKKALEYQGKNGERITDQQLADLIISLLYVASINTAIGTANAAIHLTQHPEWWEKVRIESEQCLKEGNGHSIFQSPTLINCIYETARLTPNVFPLLRKIGSLKNWNGYDIDGVDFVGVCEPVYMMHSKFAKETFTNPEMYDPNRFFENEKLKAPINVTTWGAHVHQCPGKYFAIYEMMAVLAMLTTHFKPFEIVGEIPPVNYTTPSAFGVQDARLKITPLPKENVPKRKTC